MSAVVDNQAEIINGQAVSGGYYAGLRVQAILGRAITDEDDKAGAPQWSYSAISFGRSGSVPILQPSVNRSISTSGHSPSSASRRRVHRHVQVAITQPSQSHSPASHCYGVSGADWAQRPGPVSGG